MIVYFIRHGETDFNKRCLIQGMSDIPLNDKGVQQAGVAANWFKAQNITFDKVFSSPLDAGKKTQPSFQAEHLKQCSLMQESVRWILV